jgi:endo-1,4-beta-xylanase
VPIIPGNWYTYDLTKNASTWDLKVYDFNEAKVGSISGKLTGSLPSFNYLYIGNENTNDWPSANGKIDNIELATSEDLCSDPTPLRHLAEFSGIKIGSAVKSDPLTSDSDYRETLSKEFDMLVSEYEMKFDQIWPDLTDKPEATSLSERMVEPHFEAGNSLCEFAKDHNMVVRGHTLIWHEALPRWLTKEDAGLSDKSRVWTQNDREELLTVMGKHINTTVKYYEEHYKGTVVCWDVVNEAINESSPYILRKNSTWYKGIGEDYIDKAFQYAYNADMEDGHKDLELFYNDYGGEAWNEKADAIYELVCKLKDRGVPIDGVGFQMHIYDMNKNPVDEKLASNIKRFTDKGFKVHITEMEVWPKNPASQQDLELQSNIYKEVMNICLQNPKVTAFVVWGFTDKYVWTPEVIPDYKKGKDKPFIFDESYQKKLAYCGLQEALRDKLTTSTSTTTSSPPTGTTGSTTTTTAS